MSVLTGWARLKAFRLGVRNFPLHANVSRMVFIPDQLPDFLLSPCNRLHRDFEELDGEWGVVRRTLDSAEAEGLDRKRCLTLLVGVKACEEWRDHPARQNWLDQVQFSTELRRGTTAFDDYAEKRELYTERFLERVQSLLMLGYVLANGCHRVKRQHWYPLAPAFEIVLTITPPKDREFDPQDQIVQIVRQRFRRLKDNNAGGLPIEAANKLFSEVYDTLF